MNENVKLFLKSYNYILSSIDDDYTKELMRIIRREGIFRISRMYLNESVEEMLQECLYFILKKKSQFFSKGLGYATISIRNFITSYISKQNRYNNFNQRISKAYARYSEINNHVMIDSTFDAIDTKIDTGYNKLIEVFMKGCKALEKNEINTMIKGLSVRDQCIFVLGLNLGFRVSELLSLRVKNVYDGNKVLDRVYLERRNTKGKTEGRNQLLNTQVKPFIENYIRETELKIDDYLFPNYERTNHITRQTVWYAIKKACKSIDVTGKIGTHSWRKTFAKRIYDITEHDLVKTQKALGHQSINSTISYLELCQEEVDEAITKLNFTNEGL